jgi:hypothetical protein
MSNFGALTDHFGILAIVDGAGTLADHLELVASSNVPAADSRANANDENNDIAASSFYGAGGLSEASCTYAVCKGSLKTQLLKLGELSAGVCAVSAAITTSGAGWPQLVVSGTLGCETMVAPTGKLNTFTLPTYTIVNRKQAQAIGCTIDAACRLTGSSLTCTIELAQQEDGLGEPAAHGVSGGVKAITADMVAVTGVPAWTVGEGFTETQAPGVEEGQAAYHTGSGAAEGTLARDSAT